MPSEPIYVDSRDYVTLAAVETADSPDYRPCGREVAT